MELFEVGDRVRITDVSEFSFKEREALLNKEGVVVAIDHRYIDVHLDVEAVELTIKNDLLMKPEEITKI